MTSLEQAFLAQAAFALLFPLVLGRWFNRKTGVGWRFFGYGLLVFFVLELVMIAGGVGFGIVRQKIAPNAAALSPAVMIAGIGILSALVEEFGRYLGYVVLFRNRARTWTRAVMYGLGHGGFESMVNKALTSLFSVVALAMGPGLAQNHHGLGASQLSALEAYAKSLSALTPWQVLPASMALASGLALHCSCAVLVLQLFRGGKLKWLAGAIALHAAFDLTMGMGYLLGRNWMVAGLAIVWAVVCLRLIVLMRPECEEDAEGPETFAAPPGAVAIRSAK